MSSSSSDSSNSSNSSSSSSLVEEGRLLPCFQYNFNDLPKEVRQLHADIIDVLEGNVDITSFPEEYQKKIRDYYQFSATFRTERYNTKPAITFETLTLL